MRIFVPKETAPGEKRAPVVPETAKKLVTLGAEVAVETGIGASIYRSDTEYTNAGASVVDDRWVGLAEAGQHEHDLWRREEDAARGRERT